MEQIVKEINELKKQKNAVILAHNYQLPEVQDVADFVGDSLGLSQQAGKTEAELIVFCGVHFMAETASIISPNKKVIIPDMEAGCSLAESITADDLKKWKSEHPDAVVVSYVNTTAEVKAETDYCCTSSNAVNIVNSIPKNKEILFLPDKFLGQYVKKVTGREMNIWDGACHVHEKIDNDAMMQKMETYPNAEFLIHPECGCSSNCLLKSLSMPNDRIHIHSTEGMINYVNDSEANQFVVATEVGILHRMKKLAPEKEFMAASDESVCEYMKMITIEKLLDSLRFDRYEVKVNEELAKRARLPIERMLDVN
jgi:quinolinate synthase